MHSSLQHGNVPLAVILRHREQIDFSSAGLLNVHSLLWELSFKHVLRPRFQRTARPPWEQWQCTQPPERRRAWREWFCMPPNSWFLVHWHRLPLGSKNDPFILIRQSPWCRTSKTEAFYWCKVLFRCCRRHVSLQGPNEKYFLYRPCSSQWL